MVKGRIDAPNGPTVLITFCVLVSTTGREGDLSPARYTREPSRLQTVLWAPLLSSSLVIMAPLAPSTTFQCGPSSEGTYRCLPSGVMAMRSHPPGRAFSHTVFSVTRSRQYSLVRVVK